MLDKLLDAYMQIAEALPRFDRFQNAFPDEKNLQNALAMVYEDILEFHRFSYKFFRRGCKSRGASLPKMIPSAYILQHGMFSLTRCGKTSQFDFMAF